MPVSTSSATHSAPRCWHINSAGKAASESGRPHATQELVKIRASQINGCGFCTDMHTKDAAHAGETAQRLHLVAAWREATVFTEAERAALEQGARKDVGYSGSTLMTIGVPSAGPARPSC
ncbi:hypothetical protein SHIRM173S_08775 [Streptomyces hirsutus]